MTNSPKNTTGKTPYEVQLALWCDAANAGDKAAYRKLLTEISSILRGYFLKRGVSVTDADDVIQEILISVDKARHTYDANRPFMPWLFAIVRFRFADHWRKHYAKKVPTLDIHELQSQIPDESVTQDDPLPEGMEEAVQHLPEKKKRILFLLHYEGYTAKEAAEKLGMKESAVKVAAHRIYKQLREQFAETDNG